MFGMDDDTPDVFLRDGAVRGRGAASTCRASPIVTPFPGTPLYKRLEREGRILTRNWELYDGQHVVFQPAQMSVERAAAGHGAGVEARLQLSRRSRSASGARPRPWPVRARHEPRLPLLRAQPAPLLQLRLDHRPGAGTADAPSVADGAAR